MTDPELEIIDVVQGSPEWIEAKLGIPSASKFAAVLAQGDGKVRGKYMRQLAGEQVSRLQREDFKGAAMERGTGMEPEIRDTFALVSGQKVALAGFYKRRLAKGFIGASPDGLIGEEGVVQIKSAAPDILIEIMQRGLIPSEHIPQCQGELLVTGRKWGWIGIGYSGMPLFRKYYKRDEGYIARLRVALDTFNEELAKMVEWVRKYR